MTGNTWSNIVAKASCQQHGVWMYSVVIFLVFLSTISRGEILKKCPELRGIHGCMCYNFEDGLFLECGSATMQSLRSVLEAVDDNLHSLSVQKLDYNVTTLSRVWLPSSTCVRHVHISQTNLEDIDDDTFFSLRLCIETLSIDSSNLSHVPQKAFSGLGKLISISLESNAIEEILDYSFYGLPLMKLNMKANKLEVITEYAFASLEDTLSELDLSENNLKNFPFKALYQLKHLRSLRLAWNELDSIPFNETTGLNALVFLDLGANNFVSITEDCFRLFPSTRTLSLEHNNIEIVHKRAFKTLKKLENLEIAHNRIIKLDRNIFQVNKELQSIDLSYNHIHDINGIFSNLPLLNELILSSNNILNVPSEAFLNTSSIKVLFLDKNSIKHLHVNAFVTLINVTYLDLGFNFITEVPEKIFFNNHKLTTLCLDNNNIKQLPSNVFDSLANLLELRLHFNYIALLDGEVFFNLRNLQRLQLHNNQIEIIDEHTFKNVIRLSHINLSNNRLPYIDGLFPVNVSSLISIQLSFNTLNYIDRYSFFEETRVQIRLGELSTNESIFNENICIERVELNNNNISFIEDFSFLYFRKTKYLDLSANHINQITNQTFSGLIELEELNLSQNHISTVTTKSFNILKRLRVLNMSNNILKIINDQLFPEGLPLRIINLQNCSIHKIEVGTFHGLNNLNTLLIAYNLLSPNEVAKLIIPGLRTLKLSGNNLSEINGEIFQGLPSLHNLDIDNCQIYDLPKNLFSENDKLLNINLNCNRFTSLNPEIFANNSLLREVKLNNNKLFDVPIVAIHTLNELQCLYLSDNRISSIDLSSFKIFPKLNHLALKGNMISSLEISTHFILSNIFSLDLSENNIEKLPKYFINMVKNIRSLDLSNNRIKTIFFNYTKLHAPYMQYLNLSLNPIQLSGNENFLKYYQKYYPYNNLLSLVISNSNLTKLYNGGFIMFPFIHELVLKQNKLYNIEFRSFEGLNRLNRLDLSSNKIKIFQIVCLSNLHNLMYLNLSNNLLQSIPDFSKNLKQIKILDFSFNRIEVLDNEIYNLKDLNELYLQYNMISYISDDFFVSSKKISIINLFHNDFKNVSLDIFLTVEARLKSLKLGGNPLLCSCKSLDLWTWMLEHPKIEFSKDIECKHSEDFQSQYYSELDIRELCEVRDVMNIDIHVITPNSALLSWQVKNYTGIEGFQLAFYLDDNKFLIYSKILPQNADTIKLYNFVADSYYMVCISALYDKVIPITDNDTDTVFLPQYYFDNNNATENRTELNINGTVQMSLFGDSPTSHCISVRITKGPQSPMKKGSFSNFSEVEIILTRRLGLMVGCSMGVVVFIIMVSILGYSKTTKRRLIPSPDGHMPPEFPTFGPYQYASMTIPKVSQHEENTAKEKNILFGVSKDNDGVRIKLSDNPN